LGIAAAVAPITSSPAAQIERLGSRAIALNGPDTAFACRWLPPACLESSQCRRYADLTITPEHSKPSNGRSLPLLHCGVGHVVRQLS
jgi:hypothetical protein